MYIQNHHQTETPKSNHYSPLPQRLSRDGAKKLLLQSEQQRQELEEMAVASLQRVTDQKNKAQDRAHSLEVRAQTGLHSG